MTHPARRAERLRKGGRVAGSTAVGRPDRRARGGQTEANDNTGGAPVFSKDWDDSQDKAEFDRFNKKQSEPAQERARGGKVKHGKVIVNINAGGQDDPGKLQAAHQAGIQQGAMLGARAVAARMGGGAGGPPPGGPPGGGAPPPGPMMAPPGPPGPPGPPMAPGAPGMMPRRPFAQGGNIQMMRRRDLKGRFLGGAV